MKIWGSESIKIEMVLFFYFVLGLLRRSYLEQHNDV